jgi:uncharacterized protein YndB with AHSA1/START domain
MTQAKPEKTDTRTVRVTRHFDAPAEKVFDAWLDPRIAGKFLFKTPTGKMTKVEIDARVGGKFLIIENRDGVEAAHNGEYLEIDRPRTLVFTFAVPDYPATRVTLDIAAKGTACELTLTHDGVLREFAAKTQEGWTNILETLDAYFAGL